MTTNDFLALAKKAANTNRKIRILFDKDVYVPIHKNFKIVKKIDVLIFATNEDSTGFAYKMRVMDVYGHKLSYLPIGHVESVAFVDELEDNVAKRKKFESYVFRSKDEDVWPDLRQIFENSKELNTNVMYLSSKCDQYVMAEIDQAFKQRESRTIHCGDHYTIEMKADQNGFRVWFSDGVHTWVVINPKVAIFGRRSL